VIEGCPKRASSQRNSTLVRLVVESKDEMLTVWRGERDVDEMLIWGTMDCDWLDAGMRTPGERGMQRAYDVIAVRRTVRPYLSKEDMAVEEAILLEERVR